MKNGPYELVLAPRGYPGKKYRGKYCYEHHLVWWENFQEILKEGFEIHHLNGNHRDNRIKNLVMIKSSEHRKLHGAELSQKSRIPLICPTCGQSFFVKGNNYRAQSKANPKRLFHCSRRCAGKKEKPFK